MNAPLLLVLAIPFLAAPLVYPLRRTPLAAPLAAGAALGIVALLWVVPWPPAALQRIRAPWALQWSSWGDPCA